MQKVKHISHLKFDVDTDRWVLQSNTDHQNGVALLASKFAGEFEMANWGKVLGLLHDKGKVKMPFKNI